MSDPSCGQCMCQSLHLHQSLHLLILRLFISFAKKQQQFGEGSFVGVLPEERLCQLHKLWHVQVALVKHRHLGLAAIAAVGRQTCGESRLGNSWTCSCRVMQACNLHGYLSPLIFENTRDRCWQKLNFCIWTNWLSILFSLFYPFFLFFSFSSSSVSTPMIIILCF